MLSPLDHYQQQLEVLDKEEQRNEFMLRVAPILLRYANEMALPLKKKEIKGRRWGGLKIDDYDALDKIADEYYTAAGVEQALKKIYMCRKLTQNTTLNNQIKIDESKPIFYEETACCTSPDIVMLNEYAVCASCGQKVLGSDELSANFAEASVAPMKTILVSGTNEWIHGESSVDDDTAGLIGSTTMYKDRPRMLLEPLIRLQGMKVSAFTEKEWSKIYTAVTSGIGNVNDISLQHVNRVIHRLKMSKFYKDPYVIWEKITNNRLATLPQGALWVIQYIITPQLNVVGQMAQNENTRIAASSLLYKALQLCGENDFADMVVMLNGESHLNKLDVLWSTACTMGNWKYYPN